MGSCAAHPRAELGCIAGPEISGTAATDAPMMESVDQADARAPADRLFPG